MKLKAKSTMILAGIVGISLLSGCGNSNQVVSPEASNKETKTESASSAEKKIESEKPQKLSICVWDNDTTPQFTSVTEAFKKEHPEVQVEFIDTQANEYANKLTVMLASGESDPDIIFVKDAATQIPMKEKGQILNLDEYIKRDNIDLGIYGDAGELTKIDGSNYSMPFRQDYYVLYYNKDIFDKAGVEYPSEDMTWAQYEELAKKMTSGEESNKIYGAHHHIWGTATNWAIQDGKHTQIAKDYSFFKPYYEMTLRMQDEGIVQNYANLKTGNIHYISVFEQGQAAMMPMGSWFIGTLIQDKKAGNYNFNWGVTKLPHPEGMEAGSTIGSITPVAINAKTDNPDLAWEYVKFITSKKGAETLADNGMFPAVHSDSITEKLAKIDGFPEDGKSALEISKFVLDRPIDGRMPAIKKVIEEENDLIMIEEQDIDTGIKHMNERVGEILTQS